jgi:hypothetical protein
MARSPLRPGGDFGPLGNAPRDQKDDSVGVPVEEIKTGEPPRWPPNPKKVKKNDFHAKVSGKAARARADRAPHFRRGGFVQGRKHGGATGADADEEPFKKKGKAFEQDKAFRRGGHVRKRQDGGDTDTDTSGFSSGLPGAGTAGGGSSSGPSFGNVAKAAGKAISSYKPPTPKNVQAPPLPPPGPGGYRGGGHITTAQRKALPSGDFALPGKGKGAGGKGPGSYPIDTPARARNALARGAQHASPSELATIKRKVHAKYPGIGQGGDND